MIHRVNVTDDAEAFGYVLDDKCRGCGNPLPEHKLIEYKNMPKGAQCFPDESELVSERGSDIVLKQCFFCGLIQAVGEPVAYYRDVIRATSVSAEMRTFREKQFQQWVNHYAMRGKSLIEIGCGSGEYMDIMGKTGVRVSGLEHLHESVESGTSKGYHILEGFLENEDYVIPEGPYDGFYIMNFLEHIPNPGSFIRGIANNLAEDAVGIVEVPNLDMMLEKSLYSEFIQDHLSYFTKKTLENLLEQNGFEVLSCKDIWYNYITSAIVKKRTPLDVSGFHEKQKTIYSQMQNYLNRKIKEHKTIAVWGAGHQALANLTLLDMKDYVECVIDSAVFKQHKYTPATHIPIVGPEILKTGKIQTVMIMAAGYSDEIVQILLDKWPDVSIAVLRDYGVEVIKD